MSPLNVPPADPANAVIAHTLHWLAVLLEIDDGDAERIAAYRQAAYTVRQLPDSVSAVVRTSGAPGLERLGLAPAIAAMVSDWVRTGELPVIDKDRQQPGLWPALTRALCRTLGIEAGTLKSQRKVAPVSPKRRLVHGAIHRQVWESWN